MAGTAAPTWAPDPALRRQLERLAIVAARPHGHLHTGGRRSRAVGSSIEFADHRRYSTGDDYRHIDWNVYARSDALFVKVRESEETLPVHLFLDTSASMGYGRRTPFDTGRAVLAALGWATLAAADLLHAATFGSGLETVFPPTQGRGNAARFIEFLDGLGPQGSTRMVEAVRAYVARGHPHGAAIVASDLLTPHATTALGMLAERGHEVTVLHILAPETLRPDFAEETELRDVEGGVSIEVYGDGELLDAYRQTVAAWLDEVRRFCHQRHVRYVPLEAGWPVDDIVLRRLRTHGVIA